MEPETDKVRRLMTRRFPNHLEMVEGGGPDPTCMRASESERQMNVKGGNLNSRGEYARRIKECWTASIRKGIETARLLTNAKEELELYTEDRMHDWLVEHNIPFGLSTAHRLIKIAKNEELCELALKGILPASWGTLYELQKLPREFLLSSEKVTFDLTQEEARKLVKEYKKEENGGSERSAPKRKAAPEPTHEEHYEKEEELEAIKAENERLRAQVEELEAAREFRVEAAQEDETVEEDSSSPNSQEDSPAEPLVVEQPEEPEEVELEQVKQPEESSTPLNTEGSEPPLTHYQRLHRQMQEERKGPQPLIPEEEQKELDKHFDFLKLVVFKTKRPSAQQKALWVEYLVGKLKGILEE